MAYKIAFLAYTEKNARKFFRQFAEDNREQIHTYDGHLGRIVLKDGTEIWRAKASREWIMGRRFDQLICVQYCGPSLFAHELAYAACMGSIVPEEFRDLWYNPDADMKGATHGNESSI